MGADHLGADAGQAGSHAASGRRPAGRHRLRTEVGWLPGHPRAHERRVPVWSRKGADLAAGFPEIVQAALEQLEPGTVIDGELVVWRDGRLDFGALAPRLAYRGRRGPRADLPPAS